MQHWFWVFGALLPVLYGFYKYWSRTHVKVNCWFCGLNNIIQIKCQDGWMCKHCEQYNGFKPDGDYNREIPAQYDSSLNGRLSFCSKPQPFNKSPQNGLCQECNRNQELKVAQLASFQPINPENYDQEIDNFSYHLERAYRLCPPCEAVLDETLSSKKTHILDMNLQMTGKKTISGLYSPSKLALKRTVVKTTSLMTCSIALILLFYTLSSLTTDNVLISLSNRTDTKEMTSNSKCDASPLDKLLLTPAICLKAEGVLTKPIEVLSGLVGESVDLSYLDVVDRWGVTLCLTGLALQVLATWQSGHILATIAWAALSGIQIVQQLQYVNTNYNELMQIVKMLITLLILSLSWRFVERPLASSPVKKRTPISSKLKKRTTEITQKVPATNIQPLFGQDQINSPVQSSLFKPNALKTVNQNGSILQGTNYLTLPTGPTHLSSPKTLSTISIADSSVIPPPAEFQNSATQEDTRSDGSVDSAFSNPDSITLDAAESLSSSYYASNKKQQSLNSSYYASNKKLESLNSSFSVSSKKTKTQDDVHSLIEGLSIGSLSSNYSQKKPSEFRTKSYGKDQKRSSLLCPSRLSNIMNESISSGIWRNTGGQAVVDSDARSNITLTSASEIGEALNQSLSRPASPCGSVRSQATAQSLGARSFSTPSSFQPIQPPQPIVSSWSPPPSPKGALSLCVPANPLSPNPEFGSVPSPIPNSHMSQVIYTPYGVYHPMMGPYANAPMFMMPPQSPPFGNRSPASSYGSQFSPRSFSTSSRFCDSDQDLDFSPKSTKGKSRKRECLSSSFLGSVWQSRFAIMYTTLCYLLLGSVVCAFSYSGLVPNVFSKVSIWKHNVFSLLSLSD